MELLESKSVILENQNLNIGILVIHTIKILGAMELKILWRL